MKEDAIAYRFSEHGKVADGWKPAASVTQELRRLFRSIRGRGRRGESSKLLRVSAGEPFASATDTNNNSFATRGLPQNGRLKKYWDQKQHQRNHWSLCHIKQLQENSQ